MLWHENDVCGMADMFLTLSGRRAQFIGEDQNDLIRLLGRAPVGNAVNDLTRRFLNDEAHMRAAKAAPFERPAPVGARLCRRL